MKTYKNPISTAMAEYREDFRCNKEWWTEKMGTGRNNEYLWIEFKNGDNITVQSDYFQYDGNTCLPRFRADEVAYISRYYGEGTETTTAADIVVDTDRIILYRDGVEYFRYEMTEEELKEMRRQMWELDDGTDSTAWMLNYCRAFATSKMNNNTTTTEPTDTTPTTMNANETAEFSELTHAGQCLDIYLHNTAEIYERYTVPAIERVTRAIKAGEYVSDNAGQLAKDIQEITPAMQAAARLVKRYDHLTPTAKDIEQVTRNYAAYIVDCAKYEIEK